MDDIASIRCMHCGCFFIPRFAFQLMDHGGQVVPYCSQTCRDQVTQSVDPPDARVACSSCQTLFVPSLAVHIGADAQGKKYFCSVACRALPAVSTPAKAPLRTIAVLNQKGGTAKTTTALSVAAGLARLGHATLLIDADPQGSVGASLGQQSPKTLYDVLLQGVDPRICAMQMRENLAVITANEGLAAAEVALAHRDEASRPKCLATAMQSLHGFEYVIFDCAPALSILNQNALYYAKEVLIPVSCDYLALVAVKQVLKTLRRIGEQTGQLVRVAGVLPTFYDVRNKLCLDALTYLRSNFGAKTLPPVRVNTKLAEAPKQHMTIFEYAADSHGALDYIRVVEWLKNSLGTTGAIHQAA